MSEPPTERGESLRAWALVVALAAGFALLPRLTRGCEPTPLDQPAPNFTARIVANAGAVNALTEDSGTPSTLSLASLQGHPVLLDFWATWCGPCQAESPIIQTIAERYKAKGLVVVGVNTSDQDGLAARFVAQKRLSFPIVYDTDNAIANSFGVSSLPTLVVISKSGRIVAIRRGVTSDSALDALIRREL